MATPEEKKIQELTDQLIEVNGKLTDAEAKVEVLTKEVKELKGQLAESNSEKAHNITRSKLRAAEDKLAALTSKLSAKSAKPGQHIVKDKLKHDGKTFIKGEVFTGSAEEAQALLAAGALELAE